MVERPHAVVDEFVRHTGRDQHHLARPRLDNLSSKGVHASPAMNDEQSRIRVTVQGNTSTGCGFARHEGEVVKFEAGTLDQGLAPSGRAWEREIGHGDH